MVVILMDFLDECDMVYGWGIYAPRYFIGNDDPCILGDNNSPVGQSGPPEHGNRRWWVVGRQKTVEGGHKEWTT